MPSTTSLTTSLRTLGFAAAGLAGALAFAATGLAATDAPADKAPTTKTPAAKVTPAKPPVPKAATPTPAGKISAAGGKAPGDKPASDKLPGGKPQVSAGKPQVSAGKAQVPAGSVPPQAADASPPAGPVPAPADSGPATTGAIPTGKVSGLPVPRYVSLKTDRVNLREGPTKDNRTAWVFQRAGLPVEITAEYETWRRIRDAEGTEGWVLHSLLSGRRTALVMPWAKAGTEALPLFGEANDKAQIVARLQPNVITSVKSCRDGWCRLTILQPDSREVGGYMRQDKLWGVYPNEKVE